MCVIMYAFIYLFKIVIYTYILQGSLEVKLPTIWTDGKAKVGRVRESKRVRRKKMQVREKVGKPRNTVFFQWFVARRQGLCTLSKVSKTWGFVAFPKGMAGVGHMQRIWQDIFRVAGAVQEICSSELFGGPGADFLRWVAFWSIRSSGLLRWFCFGSFAIVWRHPGMPDVLPSCVVVFVPCRVCLFWRHRTVCLKMSVLSIYLSIYPSIHLSFFSVCWSICLSTYPSLCLLSFHPSA